MQFTIYGNQQNIKGNPLGYYRTTQHSKWSPGAVRYHAWMEYVKKSYCDAGFKYSNTPLSLKTNKPIDFVKNKVRMDIKIYYASDVRADPSNVFKGIEDALFANDKCVIGSFDYDYDKECPRVDVTIMPVGTVMLKARQKRN